MLHSRKALERRWDLSPASVKRVTDRPDFPAPVTFNGQTLRWREEDVAAWEADQITPANTGAA